MSRVAESDVEIAALEWLSQLNWAVRQGSDIAPDAPDAERSDYTEVVLQQRLRAALSHLNPNLPLPALDDAFRQLINPKGSTLESCNREVHRLLVNGATVEYRDADGEIKGAQVTVIDADDPDRNDWLAVNQFTVVENQRMRRPDVVLFINGLPLVVIELKNPADPDATIRMAWRQIQTYRSELPLLFAYNAILIISDGTDARMGTLTAEWEWFKPWPTITGEALADNSEPQLRVMLAGAFDRSRFLTLVRDFIVIEDDGSGRLNKKMAGYHQFHAVKTAVIETLRAVSSHHLTHTHEVSAHSNSRQNPGGQPGDQRIGVVWHTQGSGKSLTMAFYVGLVVRESAMKNPTIVVLTDRNDLDDQLFETFARCQDLIRQTPTQVDNRADLRNQLAVESGGVVFTTIQKFFPDDRSDRYPQLSNRHNIVVIADEAHRSQYDFIDGFASHMRDALPNASFVGFTGTPIELKDANTRAVFGEYISIYDIQRAVDDGATVPIYYEDRLVKLVLNEEERPRIDPEFEQVTEGEEFDDKEKLKTKWSQLEKIVGAPKRLSIIAKDIVDHFEHRLTAIEGKAMIVCMSRRICIDLYAELVGLRPDWEHDDDGKGALKVVMTGAASDPLEWQRHIRNKKRREDLARRFRDANDPFRIVLVRDMWLTGFDAPSLHTMYIDKPMRGHGLMQAIARVNRVFRDKPGGLVVDYIGFAHELRQAIADYTKSGGGGKTAIDQAEAVSVMQEKCEVCRNLFYGFDYRSWLDGPSTERVSLLPAAQEHILSLENGKDRYLKAVQQLSLAFALAVPHDEALAIRDEVAFFQAVRAGLAKRLTGVVGPAEELELAVRQIVSKAVASEGVLDIFATAGLEKPDISILSEEFLAEVKNMPQRNLAVDLLQKLLKDELTTRRRKNVVQARSFAEMLEQTLVRYRNRSIETAQVIEELIGLARELREANARGEKLGLSEDEIAFYDALETNDSAVQVLGDEVLCNIAQALAQTIRNNISIDWTVRESVRAHLRRSVKRVLRDYGYPPDKQESATKTVLEQAELLSTNWNE